MKKHLFELVLSVAMVGAWAMVAATASDATKVDAPAQAPDAAVKVAEAASAVTS